MVEGTLVDELSVAPSDTWKRLIERHAAVSEYLQMPQAGTTHVDRYATQVGVSRRMFYRLIARRLGHLIGASKPGQITGRGRPLLVEQEEIIAEALARFPPGVPVKEVIQEVRSVCAARELPAPSDFSVIGRLRRRPDLSGLQARVPAGCSFVIDACSTDLRLHSSSNQDPPAWLLALIHCEAGQVVAHRVCCGRPEMLAVASLVLALCDQRAPKAKGMKVAVTACVAEEVQSFSPLLARNGFGTHRLDTVHSGEALYMLLGQQLGSIRLRPRPRRTDAQGDGQGVPTSIADAVVGHLITRLNAELQEAVCVREAGVVNARSA